MDKSVTIDITNPQKVLFPSGITKHDIVHYYKQVSSLMLPYLKDRLIAMERFPEGINGERFYQKNIPDYAPKWIERKIVKHEQKTTYAICNNEASLLYLANLACLTFHTWLSKADRLEYPDKLIFDLDPKRDDYLDELVEAAKGFKFILDKMKLNSYLMATGKRGMHIIIPLDAKSDFKKTREFASEIANFLAQNAPDLLTTEQRIEKRKAKIFIDINRNAFSQLAVCPYSVRAIDYAPVAAPLTWKEIEDFDPQRFNIKNILKRKDPWKEYNRYQYSIDKAKERFENLIK